MDTYSKTPFHFTKVRPCEIVQVNDTVNKSKDRIQVRVSTSGMAHNFILDTIFFVGKAERGKGGLGFEIFHSNFNKISKLCGYQTEMPHQGRGFKLLDKNIKIKIQK